MSEAVMATDERDASQRPRSDGDSWAAVLADVEADLRRTERLLATGSEPAPAVGAPAEAMLPGPFRQYVDASWAELPPFEEMPPVPAELTERIHLLRAQIVALQAEIKVEMAQWRASCAGRRAGTGQTATAESVYMDRLV